MRVQPDWPMRPFTAMTMRARGLTVVTWSAASMPAPPAPRIRTSHVISSMGSMIMKRSEIGGRRSGIELCCLNFDLRVLLEMRISGEGCHAPIRYHDTDEYDRDG